jgi:hypothetical protein
MPQDQKRLNEVPGGAREQRRRYLSLLGLEIGVTAQAGTIGAGRDGGLGQVADSRFMPLAGPRLEFRRRRVECPLAGRSPPFLARLPNGLCMRAF